MVQLAADPPKRFAAVVRIRRTSVDLIAGGRALLYLRFGKSGGSPESSGVNCSTASGRKGIFMPSFSSG